MTDQLIKPTKRQYDMLINKLEGRPIRAIVREDGSIKHPRAVGGATDRTIRSMERLGWIVSRYVVGGGDLTPKGTELATVERLRREALKQQKAAKQNETRA